MLRGTLTKRDRAVWNQRPTLQGQIDALKRKVNNTKPETQYFRITGTHIAGGTTADVVHYNITQSIISSLTFRDLITGDQWKNLFLRTRLQAVSNVETVRVIVYVPKQPGITFSPTSAHFAAIPDPSSFWILADRTATNKGYSGSQQILTPTVSFKGMKTLYDSNAARINKGEVYVTVISLAGTAGSPAYNYGFELGFCNL